ncbi:trimethylamine--corrinoid methyltransferase [Lactonifactor longoviformis]|uniref:Methyltransferase n=1 Tax=Lactonifactor longoviformis DSM 17459 TaxID=1122155 RepID=A0A1M4ZVR3_9CLOT|nr:trimethylamine methyltransferase family protein [Lactonifactor longoviformis]POP33625.1 trimethylamine--corrinoid methyltransferase [Lactonifactor longoviformis]SHF22160.1 trimethylamine:corrinoid methyltransferase [Lactonifactor longoviformis DSM 17459]
MQRYQVLSQNEIEQIHENTLRIMENIGVVMTYRPARDILEKGGAILDGERVRFPQKMVEKELKNVPSSFTMYARNPKYNVTLNTEDSVYAGPNCPPFVTDMDRGRRPGTLADFIEIIKICDRLKNVDIQSQIPCEPGDVEVARRPDVMLYNTLKYSEKPFMGSSLGYENAKRGIEMASLAFGGMEAIKEKPIMASIPCTLTPLAYDDSMLGALMAYAEARQPQLINSLAIAGMTAPTTLAGLVSVQNAEVLAGIVLAQLISPGTPIVYSGAGSNAEMSSGVLSIGSPEHALVSLVVGQLAKYYQIPCRISGALSDSKLVDAQAGYESAVTLTMGQMAGGNFILHGVGIIEGYNCTSLEKLVIDNEIIGYMKRINKGVAVNEETLAYDVIEEIGPKGTFLVHDHTLENFRDEFYMPTIGDRWVYDQWKSRGGLSVEERANKKWKEILENYGEPTLPNDIDAELQKFMEIY